MIKTWQLRGFALYLTLGVPLAASCAREANTLEGDDTSGGSSAAGKNSPTTAGTLGKAGTSASAFGGTASTAGKAGTAGEATGGASGGTTGSGGKAGAGGAGGSTGVPPDVLERADAIVYYETSHTMASDKIIQMKLFIENKSADPLPMANVTIRYWLTAEVATTLHQYFTGAEAQMPKAVFVDDGANSHVDMTFGGGSIVKGGDRNKSEIQLEISSNTTAFTQTDDFSWQPTSTTSTPNDKITLYLSDKLVWGCEPSGKCFDDTGGAGGAGGAGGQGAGGAVDPGTTGGAGDTAGAGGVGDTAGAGGAL